MSFIFTLGGMLNVAFSETLPSGGRTSSRMLCASSAVKIIFPKCNTFHDYSVIYIFLDAYLFSIFLFFQNQKLI